jgi:predicted MFS family arabinose efflux permease
VLCAAGSARWVSPDLPTRQVPLDWLGALLCLLPAACLLFAILSGPAHGWFAPQVILAAVAAVAFAPLSYLWLRRAQNPLLDLTLFAEPRLLWALSVILLGYFGFSGVSFVVAQYLQLARARSALASGLMNLPLPCSLLLGTLTAPRSILRLGAERALVSALALAWLGAALLVYASTRPGQWLFCSVLAPFGAGCGAAFATATELTLGRVSQERAALVAAVSESVFELGGALGVATLSTLLASDVLRHESVLSHAPRALSAGAAALFLALLVAGKGARSA